MYSIKVFIVNLGFFEVGREEMRLADSSLYENSCATKNYGSIALGKAESQLGQLKRKIRSFKLRLRRSIGDTS